MVGGLVLFLVLFLIQRVGLGSAVIGLVGGKLHGYSANASFFDIQGKSPSISSGSSGGEGRGGVNDASLVPDYLGKDRELVHFAVDLRWIWEQLTDMDTYMNIVRGAWRALSNLTGLVNGGNGADTTAIDILSYIRAADPMSKLKMFHGANMSRAEWFAAATGRLLLVYVEDGSSSKPSAASVRYRNALSDPGLGAFINDKVREVVFCSASSPSRSFAHVASVRALRQHRATR